MTDVFQEYCPICMAYGMTYEQYWYGDPWMVQDYAEAYILKRRLDNENAWIQGAYIANAVSVAIANSFSEHGRREYMRKPMDLFPKTKAEQKAEIREERRKLIQYLSMLKKSMHKNGGEPNG